MVNAEIELAKYKNVSRCNGLFGTLKEAEKYMSTVGGGKGQIFTGSMYRLVLDRPNELDHEGNPLHLSLTSLGAYWIIPLGAGYSFCQRRPKYNILCLGDTYLVTDENDPRLLANKEEF